MSNLKTRHLCYLQYSFFFTDADVIDNCNPSPCGTNAICNDGACSCIEEHHGDPYVGCRPECVLSTDCPREKACVRNKCVDPCPGTCATNAICDVINHVPMCSCPQGMTGNAFYNCETIRGNNYNNVKLSLVLNTQQGTF